VAGGGGRDLMDPVVPCGDAGRKVIGSVTDLKFVFLLLFWCRYVLFVSDYEI
jgi:hypothetical protein